MVGPIVGDIVGDVVGSEVVGAAVGDMVGGKVHPKHVNKQSLCKFGSSHDPLSRMMCTAETYREMTRQVMNVTSGRLVAAHEGGYSELYVPFCGHAMLEEMSGTSIRAEDPMKARINGQQPDKYADAFHADVINRLQTELRANGA